MKQRVREKERERFALVVLNYSLPSVNNPSPTQACPAALAGICETETWRTAGSC